MRNYVTPSHPASLSLPHTCSKIALFVTFWRGFTCQIGVSNGRKSKGHCGNALDLAISPFNSRQGRVKWLQKTTRNHLTKKPILLSNQYAPSKRWERHRQSNLPSSKKASSPYCNF